MVRGHRSEAAGAASPDGQPSRSRRSVAGFFGFGRPAELPQRPDTDLDDAARAVVAEVCSKAGLVWLRPQGDERFHPAWHVWHADAVHVISGIGEQLLPTLAGPVELAVPSKESGARVLTLLAWGDAVEPGTPAWDDAAAVLRAARLNATEPAEQRARWAAGTVLTRLEPVGVLAVGAGGTDEPSGAAAPPRTPATTTGRQPWHLRTRSRPRVRLRRRDGGAG